MSPRVFDYVDFIAFDDGEQPMLSILEHLAGKRSRDQLLRTMVRQDGSVVLKSDPGTRDVPFRDKGTPSWAGLNTDLCIPTLPHPDPPGLMRTSSFNDAPRRSRPTGDDWRIR